MSSVDTTTTNTTKLDDSPALLVFTVILPILLGIAACFVCCQCQLAKDPRSGSAPFKRKPSKVIRKPPPQTSHCHPSMWSISYDQLLQVDKQASEVFGGSEGSYSEATMRDVTERIIVPICQKTGKSYALYLNPKGLSPMEVFVTHAWDEPFSEFVQSIRHEFDQNDNKRKPNLWICSFAIRQGDPSVVRSLLDRPLIQAPFVAALRYATTFLVVRNSTTDVYSRIWCVCELMYAKRYDLIPHHHIVTGPDHCFGGTSPTSCLDAEASFVEDKEKIVQALLEQHDINEIDSFIRVFRTE